MHIRPDEISVPKSIAYNFWRDLDIVVFDVETTSTDYMNPDVFRVTQFCAHVYNIDNQKEPIASVNEYINPEIPTEKGAMAVTGIYNSDIDDPKLIDKHGKYDTKDSPTMVEVWGKIKRVLSMGSLWSAYNHTFDVNALMCESKRIGAKFKPKICFDPLVWERERRGRYSGNKLFKTASRFGVATLSNMKNEGGELHEADTDVKMLNSLVWQFGKSRHVPQTVITMYERQTKLWQKQKRYLDAKYGRD